MGKKKLYEGLAVIPQSPSTRMDALRVHNALKHTNPEKCFYLVSGGENKRFNAIAPMLYHNGVDSKKIEEIKGPGTYAEIFNASIDYIEKFGDFAASTNSIGQRRFKTYFDSAMESSLLPENAQFNRIPASNSEYLINPKMMAVEFGGLVKDIGLFMGEDFDKALEEKVNSPRKITKRGKDIRDIAK